MLSYVSLQAFNPVAPFRETVARKPISRVLYGIQTKYGVKYNAVMPLEAGQGPEGCRPTQPSHRLQRPCGKGFRVAIYLRQVVSQPQFSIQNTTLRDGRT